MWVYQNQNFADAVARHGLVDSLARQNGRIESARNRAEVVQRLEPRWPWFLKKEGNFRLIGEIRSVQGREVFVWHRLLHRSDPGYSPFRKLAGDRDLVTQDFDPDHFEKWFNEQVLSERVDERAEPLPATFYPWFQPVLQTLASITDQSSDVFLESPEWVSRIPHEGRDDMRAYLRIIEAIASSEKTDEQLFTINALQDTAKGSDATVIFTRIDASTWFLIAPTRAKHAPSFTSLSFSDRDTALRRSARAYPSWVLADDNLWIDIQKEADANLALSIEERQILESVAGLGHQYQKLPLFINGQAGSGKSTMLAYLFTGLLKKKIDEKLPGSPLFITYSDRLIDSARKASSRLLRTGFDTNIDYQSFDLSNLFVTWQTFLLSMLPEEERKRFPLEKRVTFRDFKASFELKRGLLRPVISRPGNYSPETIWFVIRSLIKGHESAKPFSPEDYEADIPERDRLVSADDFNVIYTSYYQHYQRQLEELNLWDDQDLVKAILSLEESETRHPEPIAALVVDEAQDFTRCELRLLIRNLAYTRFSTPALADIRVPIILAGDPLQTLSPTGFKWDTIRAGLFSELLSILGEHAHRPEYHPLQNNYRSKPGVVGFANLIQAWRSLMFNLEIKAQGAWSPDDTFSFLPKKFTLNDGSRSTEEFTRLLTDTMTIVPVDEGGEIEFVRNDPILSAIYPDASETARPFTVLSATAVKGLEFGKVVLYKFGDHELPRITWAESNESPGDLAAEYFFNKLYVGATRATQHLYVVDTVEGTTNLWSHFSEDVAETMTQRLADFLRPLDERGIPGQLLGIEETVGDLEGFEEKNPRENAMKMRDFGIDTRDAKLIRRAEYYFRRTGDESEQRLCNAFALRFEEAFADATREFLAIGRLQDAWECSWMSGDWNRMAEVIRVAPNVADAEIRTAVRFMLLSTPTPSDSIEAIAAISQLLAKRTAPGTGDLSWKTYVNRVTSTVETSIASDVDRTKIANGLEELGRQGFSGAALIAGDLFLDDGRFEDAENSWLRAGPDARNRLARLRAQREGFPQGLRHFVDAAMFEELIAEWTERGRPHGSLWISAITSAFKALNRAPEGVDMLIDSSVFPEAASLLIAIDPEMQFHGDRYKTLIREIAKSREAQLLLQILEKLRVEIPAREGYASRIRPLHLYGVEQLVIAHQEAGWTEMTSTWTESVRRLVGTGSGIMSWDLEDTLRQTDAFVLAAALELGEFWEKASEIYVRFTDARDDWRRRESRNRWLYCQFKFEEFLRKGVSEGRRRGSQNPNLVQDERISQADRWRITTEELQKAVRQPVPQLSRRAKQVSPARSSGSFKTDTLRMEFKLKNDGQTLFIELENLVSHDAFAINYVIKDRLARYGGNQYVLTEGGLVISDPQWLSHSIHVFHDSQLRLRLEKGDTVLEEYVVIDLFETAGEGAKNEMRRRASSSRTTVPQPSIKVFDLASELHVTTQTLRAAFPTVGISPRKDANSRLTFEQAERLRRHFARRDP